MKAWFAGLHPAEKTLHGGNDDATDDDGWISNYAGRHSGSAG